MGLIDKEPVIYHQTYLGKYKAHENGLVHRTITYLHLSMLCFQWIQILFFSLIYQRYIDYSPPDSSVFGIL